MDEPQRLLRHYRLNAVEAWIGYGVATVVLLLWPGAQAAPWPAVVFGYFGLLGAVGAMLGINLPKLLESAGIVVAIAVPMGLALLWVTVSVSWAPLRIRLYPYLRAAQGG